MKNILLSAAGYIFGVNLVASTIALLLIVNLNLSPLLKFSFYFMCLGAILGGVCLVVIALNSTKKLTNQQ